MDPNMVLNSKYQVRAWAYVQSRLSLVNRFPELPANRNEKRPPERT